MTTPKPSFRLSGRALGNLTAAGLALLLAQACTPASDSVGGSGGQSGTGGKGSGGSSPAGSGGNSGSGGSSASGGNSGSGGNDASGGGSGAGSGGSTGSGGGGAGSGGSASGGSSGTGGAGSDAAAGPDAVSTTPPMGLGAWMGKDNVPPSKDPPGGLKPEQVPMFVSMGFDDNPFPDGVTWVATEFAKRKNPAGSGQAATFDGTSVRATFYDTSTYGGAAGAAWKTAYMNGHELGNHTVTHAEGGRTRSEAAWTTEIKGCIDYHVGAAIGQKREDIWGFRSPFLHYNGATMAVVKTLSFWYDCSIEEGVQTDQDGSNYLWPYTLDSGSPGNAAHPNPEVVKPTTWPKGLWEMPAYKVVMPPDADAAKYGVPAGLRAKMKALHPDGIGINEAKITGLDYNLWAPAAVGAYNFTKAEFVATLKYSLDQRLKGNRAPLLMGMHSFYYSASYTEQTSTPLAERRAAVAEFLDWAIARDPDVRIVTTKAVLDWIRNPVPLKK
jgi:peptidoglycan/xylan/chitin deacetylase (PgdA/CDA1 family)